MHGPAARRGFASTAAATPPPDALPSVRDPSPNLPPERGEGSGRGERSMGMLPPSLRKISNRDAPFRAGNILDRHRRVRHGVGSEREPVTVPVAVGERA